MGVGGGALLLGLPADHRGEDPRHASLEDSIPHTQPLGGTDRDSHWKTERPDGAIHRGVTCSAPCTSNYSLIPQLTCRGSQYFIDLFHLGGGAPLKMSRWVWVRLRQLVKNSPPIKMPRFEARGIADILTYGDIFYATGFFFFLFDLSASLIPAGQRWAVWPKLEVNDRLEKLP